MILNVILAAIFCLTAFNTLTFKGGHSEALLAAISLVLLVIIN